MDTHMILTSPAGKFKFPKGIPMSHAKLIRDTVTAGFRGAIPHTPQPRPENVVRWFKDHVPGPIGENISPRKVDIRPTLDHLPAIMFEWDNTGAWSNS